jgi:hypothetical protein
MDAQQEISLWTKVDPAFAETPAIAAQQSAFKTDNSESAKRERRNARRILDALGILFWTYVILKLFVFDVDRELVGNLANYRFFFFVLVVVWLAVATKHGWVLMVVFAYVALFPIVIIGWKIPKLIYRTRSPIALLAATNVATTWLADLRHSIVVGGLAIFALFAIAVSHNAIILDAAAAALTVLILEAVVRTVRFSVGQARFLRLQQSGIHKVMESGHFKDATSPGEELLRADIVKFNPAQQTLLVQRLGTAVIVHRALGFWAMQLENYRRSAAPFFFSLFSYLWLLVRGVIGLTFLNLALYHARPHAYTYEESPGFLVFVHYVLSGFFGSEIHDLQPKSNTANILSIATIVFGILVLSSLAVSLLFAYRSSRSDSDIQNTVAQIKGESDVLEVRLREEYEVGSLFEAIKRLEELKYGLIGVVTFLSRRRDETAGEPPP